MDRRSACHRRNLLRPQILALILLCAIGLAGCSRQPANAPPTVRYGQDECAHCGMIVSDERHAAALRTVSDGQTRDLIFDDIGDMIDYERQNAEKLKVTRRYVHDFETRQWLDADSAFLLKTEKIQTPMGSGIIAFADESRRRARETELSGQPVSLGAVLSSRPHPATTHPG